MLVHEVLAKEVERAGISYAELSRRCGMDKEALRLSLNGSRNFKGDEVIALSLYFGLEMADFAKAS